MKKNFVLLFFVAGLTAFGAAPETAEEAAARHTELRIKMDREGAVCKIEWDGVETTPAKTDPWLDPFLVRAADGRLLPKEFETGTLVTISIVGAKTDDRFKIGVALKKNTYELVSIYTGKTVAAPVKYAGGPPADHTFVLDEPGTTYQIKVTRLGKDADKDKEKEIFSESLQTRARYWFGSHVGIFEPFEATSEYSLGYVTKDDAKATIVETRRRNVTMIFIGTIYPFGFEPAGAIFSPRRIQIDLATELSSAIFKKLYFGLGYDFTFFSIGVLGRFGAVDELKSGFLPGDQVATDIKDVPTVSKNKQDWGLVLCVPLDLMAGWLGRAVGIK